MLKTIDTYAIIIWHHYLLKNPVRGCFRKIYLYICALGISLFSLWPLILTTNWYSYKIITEMNIIAEFYVLQSC